jgi:predicted O-linked N-acetylglucosamine transferase (SPINDLY family)
MAALLEKATQQYNRGDLKIALATLRRLLQQERRNLNAHLLAGTIHEQQGNLAEAAKFFADAVPLSGDRKRDIGLRAAAHYLSAGQAGKALATLLDLQPHLPDDVNVIHGICSLYREAGLYEAALPYAVKLGEVARNFGNFLNAGIVLSGLGHYAKALPLLQKALDLQPGERLALSELFWCAANLCDFRLSDRLQAELEQAYAREGGAADIRENAFRALCWSGDEAYHLKTARQTAELLLPPLAERPPRRPVDGRRIRIGYVSADFCEHATMALFAGVLEAHDRAAFEVFGFCHTPAPLRQGPMRDRFLAATEHVVDILDMDDDRAAEAIRKAGIDILVDLKGFTLGGRLGIFTRRPAPVQVTYLGFPGSVAGVGMDYAVTDAIVTPPSSERFYEERLLRMPACYQSNDQGRPRVSRPASRARFGLPEEGIVFAAFHQAQKIRSGPFRAWMETLRAVPGSVLWLLAQEPEAEANLRRAAGVAGISAERLIFAPKVPLPDHLERLAAADIALDTGPYNGHTTTSDALWCGVPVVTFKGRNFAGRVSESLLAAVGLPELVAPDLPSLARHASDLAQDGNRLSALRHHLIAARDTAPLFDTTGFTRALEGHFRGIV